MMLVSLAQAKARLRFDTDFEDVDLTLIISGASLAAVKYIGAAADTFLTSSGEPHEDSNGDPIGVPEDVQNATLYLVGWLSKNRDEDPNGELEFGRLPRPVTMMLYPYRTPVIA